MVSTKILVIGAGAIGTFIAARLSAANVSTVLLGRKETVTIIRRRGVRVLDTLNGNVEQVKVHCVDGLDDSDYDTIFLAVKSFDTQTVVSSFLTGMSYGTRVVCLQNGVGSEELVAEMLPKVDVIAAIVTYNVRCTGAGKVVLLQSGGVGLSGDLELVTKVSNTLRFSHIDTKVYDNMKSMKWSKLLTNSGQAISALTSMTPRELLRDKVGIELIRETIRECHLVMQRNRIGLVDLPRRSLKYLVPMMEVVPRSILRVCGRVLAGGSAVTSQSIMLRDFVRGKSEVDSINGAILAEGKALGISTPVNAAVVAAAHEVTEDPSKLEKYRRAPDEITSF